MTRFARLPRPLAGLALAALAALIGLGLALAPAAPSAVKPPMGSDIALYRAVVADMRRGEPYERAAVRELRAGNFPLKPFIAVRPPLLAQVLARLPNERTGDIVQLLLAVGVALAWAVRLRAIWPQPWRLTLATLCLLTGVGWAFGGGGGLFHDAWAGLLITLSLAVRTDKRFLPAAALGLLAGLIRELAIPYLLVMAGMALIERRRVEGATFAAAAGLALAALGLHAQAVHALVTASDPASQGWMRLGGWSFVLQTASWNLIPALAGAWAAAVLAPLALAGATAGRDGTGWRLAAILFGYTLGFMAIGRPENNYWGLLVAPLMALALCFAPGALRDMIRAALGQRPGPETTQP